MSTALVHDYLLVMRGAERTFAAMAECWPEARIYTLLYDSIGTHSSFDGHKVTASYLQRLHLRQHNFRRALPLFPRAVETLPVGGHDLIISSSSAFAHGVKAAPEAVHVCYCHSPFRYAWHERERAYSELPPFARPVLRRVLDRVRAWDLRAAGAVTHYIANSETTRRRIQDFYRRDSTVVHPPVNVERFSPGQPEDYALIVTEIVRHKRIDLALEAARQAGQPIRVVGTGPDLDELRVRFGDSAEFLGRVSDAELAELYARARVYVMPTVEEFGIAAVEAQAAGRPVVAVAAGGALETVLPEDDVGAMAEALRYTDFDRFAPEAARENASRFAASAFGARLRDEVAKATRSEMVSAGPQLSVA